MCAGNNLAVHHQDVASQQTWQDVNLCVRISNESRKIGFLMRLMSLTSIISIMLLMNFVEPSQSHLCSDPRQEQAWRYDAGTHSI